MKHLWTPALRMMSVLYAVASPPNTRRGPCSALRGRTRGVLGSILGGGKRR